MDGWVIGRLIKVWMIGWLDHWMIDGWVDGEISRQMGG